MRVRTGKFYKQVNANNETTKSQIYKIQGKVRKKFQGYRLLKFFFITNKVI